MFFDTNLWAILAGGLSAVIIGFIWYAPPVFGNMWIALARLNPEKVEDEKKKMPLMAFAGFVAATILAWVMAQFALVWGSLTLGSAIELGFWIWLGFMATTLIHSVLWEQKSIKYFAINAGYWLLTTIVISIIVSLWI